MEEMTGKQAGGDELGSTVIRHQPRQLQEQPANGHWQRDIHHHSSPSSLAILGGKERETVLAQQRLVVFLRKPFPFGQAQHFMCANAVFCAKDFWL